MNSPCRGCKMSGKTAPRVEAIVEQVKGNMTKPIDQMSDEEILRECSLYMALKNGPIHGLELESALQQTRETLSSLPIMHVKIMLESAVGKGYVPSGGNAGGGGSPSEPACVQCGLAVSSGDLCNFETLPGSGVFSKGEHKHRAQHHSEYHYSNFFTMALKINEGKEETHQIWSLIADKRGAARQFCKVARLLKMDASGPAVSEKLLLVQVGSVVPTTRHLFRVYTTKDLDQLGANGNDIIFRTSDSSPDYSFARWIISGKRITGVHLETNASAATQPITKEITLDENYDCAGHANASANAIATSASTNTNAASTTAVSVTQPTQEVKAPSKPQAKARKNIAKALMNKADPSYLNPKKENWNGRNYVPFLEGQQFIILNDDDPTHYFARRVLDDVECYIPKSHFETRAVDEDEVVVDDERPPFPLEIATAKYTRHEKDLPPRNTWNGNTYVPYTKGERFKKINDVDEHWYRAVRLTDGTHCYIQKNLFEVKTEQCSGPEFKYIPTPLSDADRKMVEDMLGLGGDDDTATVAADDAGMDPELAALLAGLG